MWGEGKPGGARRVAVGGRGREGASGAMDFRLLKREPPHPQRSSSGDRCRRSWRAGSSSSTNNSRQASSGVLSATSSEGLRRPHRRPWGATGWGECACPCRRRPPTQAERSSRAGGPAPVARSPGACGRGLRRAVVQGVASRIPVLTPQQKGPRRRAFRPSASPCPPSPAPSPARRDLRYRQSVLVLCQNA